MPWGHPGEHHDFEPQRHDDGYLEVIGFTMTSLVSGPARDLPGAPTLLCPWLCPHSDQEYCSKVEGGCLPNFLSLAEMGEFMLISLAGVSPSLPPFPQQGLALPSAL